MQRANRLPYPDFTEKMDASDHPRRPRPLWKNLTKHTSNMDNKKTDNLIINHFP